jgi:hypothetical protein
MLHPTIFNSTKYKSKESTQNNWNDIELSNTYIIEISEGKEIWVKSIENLSMKY